jgi:hypothetical protein
MIRQAPARMTQRVTVTGLKRKCIDKGRTLSYTQLMKRRGTRRRLEQGTEVIVETKSKHMHHMNVSEGRIV